MSVEITSGHFLDSNIWIYALTQNQSEQKQKIAAQLIQTSDVVISTQVINEVCVNLKKKANFSEDQIRSLVISFYQGSGVIAFDTGIVSNPTFYLISNPCLTKTPSG